MGSNHIVVEKQCFLKFLLSADGSLYVSSGENLLHKLWLEEEKKF